MSFVSRENHREVVAVCIESPGKTIDINSTLCVPDPDPWDLNFRPKELVSESMP